MTPEFGRILSQAMRQGVDVSLRELVHSLGLPPEDVLGSAMKAASLLDTMGLVLEPDVTKGDYDARRALKGEGQVSPQSVQELIEEDENSTSEFKSTLVCDLRALRNDPPSRVKSAAVTHSALKTICAFANSGGGRLIIGVENNGEVCGLAPDFEVMNADRDKWELHLRSLIEGRFWRGKLVNSFVATQYLTLSGAEVAIIDVVGRSESTFLKHLNENRHEFFIRQGNRTVSLDIHEFEDYVSRRLG